MMPADRDPPTEQAAPSALDIEDPEGFFWDFPGLSTSTVRVTSRPSSLYNCYAYAAEDLGRWWGVERADYWPAHVKRLNTIDAFVAAYATLGYKLTNNRGLEAGVQKIALYAAAGTEPTHAARQLPNGKWTSKCGSNVDIEYDLAELEGGRYGRVAVVLGRPAVSS